MLESFEKIGKPTFRDERDRTYIRFGSMRDDDLDAGIRGGQLILDGYAILTI